MPSFWNIRVLNGPVPALVWPIERRVEHRLLEGFGRADVALERTGLHGDAVAGAGELDDSARHHLAVLDQVVERFEHLGDQIGRRIRFDLLVERIAGLEADIDLVAGRLLEAGREIPHARHRPWLTRMVISAARPGPVRPSRPATATTATLLQICVCARRIPNVVPMATSLFYGRSGQAYTIWPPIGQRLAPQSISSRMMA